MKNERLDQLETTIMELGAEIFRTRKVLNKVFENSQNVSKLLQGMRQILADKGVINEFDLSQVLEVHEIEAMMVDFHDTDIIKHFELDKDNSH